MFCQNNYVFVKTTMFFNNNSKTLKIFLGPNIAANMAVRPMCIMVIKISKNKHITKCVHQENFIYVR